MVSNLPISEIAQLLKLQPCIMYNDRHTFGLENINFIVRIEMKTVIDKSAVAKADGERR